MARRRSIHQGNLLDASNLLNGNNYSDSIWGL
jgi:hypothetical protein